jgi:hypothetical protein
MPSTLDEAEEGIVDTQVGILTEATGEERAFVALPLRASLHPEAVPREVVAIVEMTITRPGMADRQTYLMDLVVVGARQDDALLLALEE